MINKNLKFTKTVRKPMTTKSEEYQVKQHPTQEIAVFVPNFTAWSKCGHSRHRAQQCLSYLLLQQTTTIHFNP